MNRLMLALLGTTLLLGSCRKKGDGNTEVTFNNRLNKDVVLTVYPTMDDYANVTNPVLRTVIRAGEIAQYPGSTFAAGKTYYMDWHSDNFYQSNWFNDNYPQEGAQVAIKPVTGNNSYYTEPALTGNSRIVYLSNNGTFSKWRAINAYMFSTNTGYVSFWSSLTDAQKIREVTVRKNFIAEYTYRNAAGTLTTDNLPFKVMRSEEAFIQFMGQNDSLLGSMISGKLPTAPPPTYNSNTKDTVLALFPNSDYYFMMVRD
ncbi:MAG: hypothetical protein JNK00_03185 [Flavipsychrobacter sp.]|nr:hypothetical protein [Flavipsychrobacter sp.]